MDSITKNRQPVETLRAMVGRAYGPGQAPADDDWVSDMSHGWFNAAYRIRLRDGRTVVVKIAPPPGIEVMTYERGAMATELSALRLIREHTSVPTPAVDFADLSRELCDSDYFFMPYIDADNLAVIQNELPAGQLAAYHQALGAINRELNSIRGAAFGPLAGPRWVDPCPAPRRSALLSRPGWAPAGRRAQPATWRPPRPAGPRGRG
jgi:aminoglycoside phosphotransferase (APT) family kinase protein